MKQRLLRLVPFVLGFGLGLWLFRWSSGGTAVGWIDFVYRFGIAWHLRVDHDCDGTPDRIEYVKPRNDLVPYVIGFGAPRNPDYRELIWKLGPVERVRVWFQPPVNHNIIVASVSFRRGSDVVVAGHESLCTFLLKQPLPPYGLGPAIEELGCGVFWPL